MSIAFGIAVITVVPGELGKYPDRYSHQQSNNHHAAIVHGWPISFLWRTPFRWLDEPSTSPSAKAWNVTESVRDFSWPALAFDAAFAIVGIAAFTGFVESRRRRRSRFFQFTLRELFVCTTSVAILFGWWMHRRRANTEVEEHLSRIPAKGWQTDPDFPLWIRNIAGDELLSRTGLERPRDSNYLLWNSSCRDDIQFVAQRFPNETTIVVRDALSDDDAAAISRLDRLVNLECQRLDSASRQRLFAVCGNLHNLRCLTPVNEAALMQITAESKLECLIISDANGVTELGWTQLRKLTRLKDLSIERASLTPAATKLLGDLTSLRRLSIFGSTITDADIANLSRLIGLEELELGGAKLSDDGLRSLQKLRELRYLGLYGARVSAANLRAMITTANGSQRPFPHLRVIDLRGATGFKLADVSSLAALENLDEMRVYAHEINNDAIAALKTLPRLKTLDVSEERGWATSQTAIETLLKKALPNCEICVEW